MSPLMPDIWANGEQLPSALCDITNLKFSHLHILVYCLNSEASQRVTRVTFPIPQM